MALLTTPTPALREDGARPPRASVRNWFALAVLMLPVLISSIDNTVLSFALPVISETLRPSAAAQLWIVDAYPLVLAGLLVAMGNLGDRWGRRRLLLIGATGFALVSIVAAFAPTARAPDSCPRWSGLLWRHAHALDPLASAQHLSRS